MSEMVLHQIVVLNGARSAERKNPEGARILNTAAPFRRQNPESKKASPKSVKLAQKGSYSAYPCHAAVLRIASCSPTSVFSPSSSPALRVEGT